MECSVTLYYSVEFVTGLRGQAYDGAANMAGIYSGPQAIIKKHQPLAPYVHCRAHCVNLITQHPCTALSVVCDTLQWAHELGVLFGQSMKMKLIFQDIAKAESRPAQSGPCVPQGGLYVHVPFVHY